ncbi:hypothetical protein LZ30DRAFT_11185 [Colletotrichum cereale]|nr:hypothetical protein LZ30DRAFT_11185 [Colletotrichum cereale]
MRIRQADAEKWEYPIGEHRMFMISSNRGHIACCFRSPVVAEPFTFDYMHEKRNGGVVRKEASSTTVGGASGWITARYNISARVVSHYVLRTDFMMQNLLRSAETRAGIGLRYRASRRAIQAIRGESNIGPPTDQNVANLDAQPGSTLDGGGSKCETLL